MNPGRFFRLCVTTVFTIFVGGLPVLTAQEQEQEPRESVLPEAFVEQPRAFGYVLGDVITQRVLLERAGVPFELARLPTTQRVGSWLERRTAHTEKAVDGRRWLVIEYQLISAPRILTLIAVPPLLLDSNESDVKLLVPEWIVSVSPLTRQTVFDASGLGELRPDRESVLIATMPLKRRLWFWLIALVMTSAAWAAWIWWRNRLAALNQPFARAWHEISKLDPECPQAWQVLHRAFDRTAGCVVHMQTLMVLFEQAPYLQPLRVRIEAFFAASSERFFGAGTPVEAVTIRSLCDSLRQVERWHER